MVLCKLDKLATEFTPGRITLHVELVPADGDEFDEPLDSAAGKLDAVANYARSTFGVRTSKPDDPAAKGKPAPTMKTQEQRWEKADKKVLAVVEKRVKLARESGDTSAIAKAESALDMHRQSMKRHAQEAKESAEA